MNTVVRNDSLSEETISSYKSILQELKASYSKRLEQRRLLEPSSKPEWKDIEKAQEMQALINLQIANFYPTSPDYFEAHDNEFSGLSR